jgi:hypothetical protein
LPRTLVAVEKFKLDLDICEGLFERRTGASDSYRFASHYATGVGLVMEVASFGFKTRKTHFHLDLMHTRKSRPKFNEVRWKWKATNSRLFKAS